MYADQNSTIVAAETANTNLKSYKMKADIHGQDGKSIILKGCVQLQLLVNM